MEIRRLDEADASVFRELRLRALRDHPDAFLSSVEDEERLTVADWAERFRPRTDPAQPATYGAFVDGRLVGAVTTVREARRKVAHKAAVVGMYVTPQSRGQGVGRALVEHALAELRARGDVEIAFLSVVAGNTAARALYASCGFAPFGLEHDAWKLEGRYRDEEFMALRIRPRTDAP